MTLTTATVAFCAVTAASLVAFYQRNQAQVQRSIAVSEKIDADQARKAAENAGKEEERQRKVAEGASKQAESRRIEAVKASMEAKRQQMAAEEAGRQEALQRTKAEVASKEAESQRTLAVMARDNAETARDEAKAAQREEEYKAYVAGIGAAAARIDEGAFDVARSILEDFAISRGDLPQDGENALLLNWEWGRLMRLCELYSEQRAMSAPIDSLAVSPDGSKLATGSRDHLARIQDMASGQVLAKLRHHGAFVHSVAWSPDGRFLATGSSDPNGFVQLWDVAAAQSGAETAGRPLTGHSLPATRVRFSVDGH
ncbi:MAG: hypothetical protein WD176_03390, partial [Pirellulales bacterium]